MVSLRLQPCVRPGERRGGGNGGIDEGFQDGGGGGFAGKCGAVKHEDRVWTLRLKCAGSQAWMRLQ